MEPSVLLEIGTWPWLTDLESELGRPCTLADVPGEVWDRLVGPAVDLVWLMGVWERSPAGAAIARQHPSMRAAQQAALPDGTDVDVVGSAYCIRRYEVDPRFGGAEGLAAARAALAERGARLVLDWVPNHVAPDHPWVDERPELLVLGTEDDLRDDPGSFLRHGDQVFALGRDPYFPAWPEVLQLDTTSPALREAAAAELVRVAEHCDGVRADMAMLVLDDVVARTWGRRASAPLPGDPGYWPTVIAAVREAHPGFLFLAEAYWGREGDLLAQGIDACYDKVTYDRLVGGDVAGLRAHLSGVPEWHRRTVRFVENHDEPRAAAAFVPAGRHLAAALAVLTLPGVALVHEGQIEGRRVHVPVTLGRRPLEPADPALAPVYAAVLGEIGRGLRRGTWAPATAEGWPEDRSCEQILAWSWDGPDGWWLAVVNLGGGPAHARVRTATPPPGHDPVVRLHDVLTGAGYDRDRHELAHDGLFVGLGPFGAHLLRAGTPTP